MKITAKVSVLWMILLTSCATLATPSLTPKQVTLIPSTTATLSPTHAIPTITLTLFNTLEPAQVKKTMEPLLKEPMNCSVPCFRGIVPGKTHLDEVRTFFSSLGFTPFEGDGFYTIEYKPDSGGFSVTFYTSGTIVENIVVRPYITKQTKEASSREWLAYSPETLIKQYGKPSRVQFALDWGPNFVIVMIMYFDTLDLTVFYSGYNMIPNRPHSPLLCPLTAPFDNVRLWTGYNSLNTPSYKTVSLEKATVLTTDQFTKLMLGDPKKACFTVHGDAFK